MVKNIVFDMGNVLGASGIIQAYTLQKNKSNIKNSKVKQGSQKNRVSSPQYKNKRAKQYFLFKMKRLGYCSRK